MTRLTSYFDINYAARAAIMLSGALGQNLKQASILALDEESVGACQKLGVGRIVSKLDFLATQPRLHSALANRSKIEQIFTMGPTFLLSEMKYLDDNEWLVYCDSDLIFYGQIEDYLKDAQDFNVIVTPHRHFWWNRKRLGKYGNFNVGLVAFRNNQDGISALNFWAEACISWCFDVAKDGKYADQKYLEQFETVSEKVFVDSRLGANLAPWNSTGKYLTKLKDGEIKIRASKVWFFHAQGIKKAPDGFILGHLRYLSIARKKMIEIIYKPYFVELKVWGEYLGVSANATTRQDNSVVNAILCRLEIILSKVLRQRVKFSTLAKENSNDSNQ